MSVNVYDANSENINILLSLKFPYYNLSYDFKKSRIRDLYNNFKPIIHNYIPNFIKEKNKIEKFKDKYVFIEEDWDRNEEINNITDYFTEYCRIECKFYNNISPLEYWERNKRKIINDNVKTLNHIDINKIRNVIYNQTKNNAITNLDNIRMSRKNNIYDYNYIGLEKLRQNVYEIPHCSNFRITLALTVLQMFKVKKWLDISAGWGDRLIASILYGVDLYYAVDPNKCLHGYYKNIINELDVENKSKYVVLEDGFETAEIKENDFDIVFTSPPFFDKEIYSTETKDSVILYNNVELWFENFLMFSLRKAYEHLIKGGHMVLYIDEGIKTNYVNKMVEQVNKFMHYEGKIYYYYNNKRKIRHFFVWRK